MNIPQAKGKLERFWLEYDRPRWRFDTLDAFLEWRNDQIHDRLWQDTQLGIRETPRQAFQCKLPSETLVRLEARLAEGPQEGLTAGNRLSMGPKTRTQQRSVRVRRLRRPALPT